MNPKEGQEAEKRKVPVITFSDVSVVTIREVVGACDGKRTFSPKDLITKGLSTDRVLDLFLKEPQNLAGKREGISHLHFLEEVCGDYGISIDIGDVDLPTRLKLLRESIALHLNKIDPGILDSSATRKNPKSPPVGSETEAVLTEREKEMEPENKDGIYFLNQEGRIGDFADFSFFDGEAQMSLQQNSPFELCGMMISQPDMSGRFLHEFWRSGRKREIYEAFRLIQREEMPNFFVQMIGDLSDSTARICSERNVSLNAAAEFVNDIAIIVVKARHNKPFETELSWVAEQLAYDISLHVIRNVKKLMSNPS